MKLLAVDASAVSASVALVEDQTILAEAYCNVGLTHSQTLVPMMRHLLSCACVPITEVGAFAVSVGPGSFTGVRIGVSAVKGLAFTGEKPCVPISTLEAIAEPFRGQRATVCALMDARCKQFYQAFFSCDGEKISRLTEDRAITAEQLEEEISQMPGEVLLAGDGAQPAYRILGGKTLRLAPPALLFQRASSVGLLGLSKLNAGFYVQAEDLTPVYLRPPQAERELAKKMKG